MGIIDRLLKAQNLPTHLKSLDDQPIIYSWIENGKFAIGPMPRSEKHWRQLEAAGFRSRFSCCYQEEEVYAQPPSDWLQASVALPDHRQQEKLNIDQLEMALISAERIIENQPATYIHCFAGQQRSPLVAVGIVALREKVDVLKALDLVRLCHPPSFPLFNDLSLLDELISS